MNVKNSIKLMLLSTGFLIVGCIDNSYPEYVISKDGRFGYMSANGKIVISNRYEHANDFNGIYAIVRTDNYVPCVIDTSGKILWKFDYTIVGKIVSDGLLTFEDINAKNTMYPLGYIDIQTGNVKIPPNYSETSSNFQNGLARVSLASMIDEKTGCETYLYIDKTGKKVSPIYYNASNFEYNHAVVMAEEYKWILIDNTFKNTSGRIFENMPNIVGNDRIAVEKECKAALYDFKGNQITDFKFEMIGKFKEGLAWAKVDNGKGDSLIGYIDRTGKFVIPPKFDGLSTDFSEGLAYVTKDGKTGFIDKTGKWILVSDRIVNVADKGFRGGYCLVETTDEKIMLIDKKGKFHPLPPNIKVNTTFMGID